MTEQALNDRSSAREPPSQPSVGRMVLQRLIQNRQGRFGLIILSVMFFVGIFAPLLAPYDPILQHDGSELAPPSRQFLLGTDELGRDLLSQDNIRGTDIPPGRRGRRGDWFDRRDFQRHAGGVPGRLG